MAGITGKASSSGAAASGTGAKQTPKSAWHLINFIFPVIIIGALAYVVYISYFTNACIPGFFRQCPGGSDQNTYYSTTIPSSAFGIQGNVTINSNYTCDLKTNSYGYTYYELHLSGTAAGPPGSMLEVASTGLVTGGPTICPGWTAPGGGVIKNPKFESEALALNYPCFRDNGDPTKISWSATIENLTKSEVDQVYGGAVTVIAMVNIYANVSSEGIVTLNAVPDGEATNNSYLAGLDMYNLTAACH